MRQLPLLVALALAFTGAVRAELKLPAIIGDRMVLQQKQENPIWGWDDPGTSVTVTFAGQSVTGKAAADGRWEVKLAARPANAAGQVLVIAGSSRREIREVLIGEVWMCSGQSNMGFQLASDWNGDLESAASRLPLVRLIKVPLVGTQELKVDFKGEWKESTPETSRSFSAVGFLFGRYLHQILGVPVGLIDNAWGGSAAEAWVRRTSLEKDPRFRDLMERTLKREVHLQSEQGKAEQATAMEKWRKESAAAKAAGSPAPRGPVDWLTNNARPGNIFAGMVHPTAGYGIKGVIWYQGESNATRAIEYRDLFPFMIEQWRKEWKQGDFPFYWVQLADFRAEKPVPGDSDWAELRESQTRTLALPQTGQAVIIDLGEGRDIHPRNKHDVAARLVRWALAKDYGMAVPYRSPEYKAMAVAESKVTVTFDCFGSTLYAFDTAEVRGFAVCGADRVWHWATGKVVGKDQVELTCAAVPTPVAVRYAWADNPACNLYSKDGLPATPFRTDDFPLTTAPKAAP